MRRPGGPSRSLRDICPDDLLDRILNLCNAQHSSEGPQQPNGGTSDVTLDSPWSPTSKGIDAMGAAAGTSGGGLSYTQLVEDDEMLSEDDELLRDDDEDGRCLIEEMFTPENLT